MLRADTERYAALLCLIRAWRTACVEVLYGHSSGPIQSNGEKVSVRFRPMYWNSRKIDWRRTLYAVLQSNCTFGIDDAITIPHTGLFNGEMWRSKMSQIWIYPFRRCSHSLRISSLSAVALTRWCCYCLHWIHLHGWCADQIEFFGRAHRKIWLRVSFAFKVKITWALSVSKCLHRFKYFITHSLSYYSIWLSPTLIYVLPSNAIANGWAAGWYFMLSLSLSWKRSSSPASSSFSCCTLRLHVFSVCFECILKIFEIYLPPTFSHLFLRCFRWALTQRVSAAEMGQKKRGDWV